MVKKTVLIPFLFDSFYFAIQHRRVPEHQYTIYVPDITITLTDQTTQEK